MTKTCDFCGKEVSRFNCKIVVVESTTVVYCKECYYKNLGELIEEYPPVVS